MRMEEEFAHELPIARLRTHETDLHISEEVLRSQEKLVDALEDGNHKPETSTEEVMSEEHLAISENPTDEEPEMSDTDDPNLSGLSHLDPDPSLGCLPRGFSKQRSTTRTYVAPEEMPESRAWNYLTKRNIIELFEYMTADIFFHRFPSPIDYMIEATERARLKHQRDDNYAEESSARNRRAKDRNIKNESTKDMSGAVKEGAVTLFPSKDDYINDVILVETQYDVSSYDSQAKTAKEEEARDTHKNYAPHDEADDDVKSIGAKTLASGDDVDAVTCFPIDESRPAELEFKTEVEKLDVRSPEGEDHSLTPRLITSVEALKLLSYLS